MPKHSYILGHLLALKPFLDSNPKDAHKVYHFVHLARTLKSNIYYFDPWPLAAPMLITTSPEIANQVCQTSKLSTEKPPTLIDWFKPLAGGPSLFDSNGHHWKSLRNLFSPAFSANHTLSLVPSMVECALEYCNTLRSHALANDVFQLDPVTLRFVMDLMGKLILYGHPCCRRERTWD